jgi:hypothetical protein
MFNSSHPLAAQQGRPSSHLDYSRDEVKKTSMGEPENDVVQDEREAGEGIDEFVSLLAKNIKEEATLH